jgi:hypothetical protein
MHFVRLFGGSSAGRTEKRAAVLLQRGESVWLKGTDNHAVQATLTVTEVESIKIGRAYVKYLIRRKQIASDMKSIVRNGKPALKISGITCIS